MQIGFVDGEGTDKGRATDDPFPAWLPSPQFGRPGLWSAVAGEFPIGARRWRRDRGRLYSDAVRKTKLQRKYGPSPVPDWTGPRRSERAITDFEFAALAGFEPRRLNKVLPH